MTQATTWGVPLTGPANPTTMATRMDDSLDALLSSNRGASRPSYAVAGTTWVKVVSSSVEELYLYDGTHDVLTGTMNPTTGAWVPAGQGDKVIAVTADLTLTTTHNNALLVVDATSAAVALTLPAIADVGEPFNVRVKKSDSSANAVTIARSGTDTINGGTDSLSLSAQNAAVSVSADADTSPDNWVSVEGGGGVSESELDALRDVAANAQTTSYTLALSDRGKSVDTTAGVTVPPNGSIAFSVGSVVTITNTSASGITITQGSGVTLRLAGTTSAGNRTLAAYGMATLRKVDTDTWFISGAGIS